jgi:hypothetical protein
MTLSAAIVVCHSTAPASGTLIVDLAHVGIPSWPGGHIVRNGAWTPLFVDVSLEGGQGFDGEVQVLQIDGDGDVILDAAPLHLREDSGGTQRVLLYALPTVVAARSSLAVRVVDAEGTLTEVVSGGKPTYHVTPLEPPQLVNDDGLLVLSLGAVAPTRLQDLFASMDEPVVYGRAVHVGQLSPGDVPELWIGLESVDVVIWDQADAGKLSMRQLEALTEWVRQGGRLLVAAARTADTLSALTGDGGLLPVTLGGVFSTANLPELRRVLLGDRESREYTSPVLLTRATPTNGAKVLHHEPDIEADIVVKHRLGRGEVIFCAADLRDLFRDHVSPRVFYQKVLSLKVLGDKEDAEPISLFPHVAGAVAFSTSGSWYLVGATLFSLAYVLLATFGVWGFLATRRWKEHNWTGFALVALLASVVSIVSVGAVRGVDHRVHQLTILDVEAGDAYAHGTALIGLKTATDTELDLWLPHDTAMDKEPGATPCFLRPIPPSPYGEDTTRFADTDTYRVSPGEGVLEGVRIRSTLKRLEGRWEGRLDGVIRGQVSVTAPVGLYNTRITDESFIINDLGVDLRNCWILHAAVDIFAPDGRHSRESDRSDGIYAYRIGELRATGQPVRLAPLCYVPETGKTEQQARREKTLDIRHREWGSDFLGRFLGGAFSGSAPGTDSVIGREQEALLLLSTIGDIDPVLLNQGKYMQFNTRTFARDRLRHLDLRERLVRDCVYLIGFADDPGPVRLAYRKTDSGSAFRVLQPQRGHRWTMYRVRIPASIVPASAESSGTTPPVDGEPSAGDGERSSAGDG